MFTSKTQKTIAVHVMPPAMTEMTAVQMHTCFAGVSAIAYYYRGHQQEYATHIVVVQTSLSGFDIYNHVVATPFTSTGCGSSVVVKVLANCA